MEEHGLELWEIFTVQMGEGKTFQIKGKGKAKLERKKKGKNHDVWRNLQQFGLVRAIKCKTHGVAGGEQVEVTGGNQGKGHGKPG